MGLEITAVANGAVATAFFVADRECVVIGRSSKADVTLKSDASLSRMHFEIASVSGGFTVRDLGSSNGTYVQGQRIHEHRLADREVVVAGRTAFLVRTVTPQPGQVAFPSAPRLAPAEPVDDSELTHVEDDYAPPPHDAFETEA